MKSTLTEDEIEQYQLQLLLNKNGNIIGKGNLALDQDVTVGLLLAKLEIVEQIISGFAYEHYFNTDTGKKLNILKNAANYVATPTIKERFFSAVSALSQAEELIKLAKDTKAADERGEKLG